MKILYKILHFFILITCLILQISFAEHIKLFYVNFDLIMVAVVCISLVDGMLYGIFYGFFVGLLLDLLVGNIVGISAFVYSIGGFIASRLMEVGFRRKNLSFIFIIFLITEISLIVAGMIRYLFNFNLDILDLGVELLIKPVFNIIVFFIIFPFIRVGSEGVKEFGF